MTKEELNKEIEKLKVSLEAHEEQVKDLNHDLKIATQRLEDCDKPKLTSKQFEDIHNAVESAIEGYSFDNVDLYEPEFAMDYDGKVYLDNISTDVGSELAEDVITGIEKLFGVADESDDTDTVPSE